MRSCISCDTCSYPWRLRNSSVPEEGHGDLYYGGRKLKSPKMTQCACMEMTFRRSAKSYNVKTCLMTLSLLRDYKLSRLFSYFFLHSLVLRPIINCFSLYQESIRRFWFSRNYVFPAFSQFKISYPQPRSNAENKSYGKSTF